MMRGEEEGGMKVCLVSDQYAFHLLTDVSGEKTGETIPSELEDQTLVVGT